MLDSLSNKVGNIYRGVANMVSAPPTTSVFKETGQIIPSEFIAAGDQLVKACPAWQWKPAISEDAINKYLPKEKQFLVTDAISNKRINDILNSDAQEKEVLP